MMNLTGSISLLVCSVLALFSLLQQQVEADNNLRKTQAIDDDTVLKQRLEALSANGDAKVELIRRDIDVPNPLCLSFQAMEGILGAVTSDLPSCPCVMPEEGPSPEGFMDPAEPHESFHPGASHCIRSTGTGAVLGLEAGQQCCYNADGTLITKGRGGGSVDRFASGIDSGNLVAETAHWLADVFPYWYCKCSVYTDYRPVNNANNCPESEVSPCED